MRTSWPFHKLTVVAVALWAILATSTQAVFFADQEEEKRLRERALKLNDVTGEDPITGQIIALIEEKEKAKKLLAVAVKMAREKEQPFNINATYILARTAQGLDEVDTASTFYRLNAVQSVKLGSSQKLIKGYTNWIDMLNQHKRFDESEKVSQEFLELPGDENIESLKRRVWRIMIRTQARQGKIDDALKRVENKLKTDPDNLLIHELKAQVLHEGGRFDQAAKVYEDVLGRINTHPRLNKEQKDILGNDIRYTLSHVYVDMKKIDKASEQLKALLDKEPNNPTYNNDLGFIWADNDMNLAEAEKLIRRALEEDRKQRRKSNPDLKPEDDQDSAAYLDSLGWVLYKAKKYKEALAPLQQAVKQEDGQHLEIYDHLGELYIALDQKEKALETWKKGLECKPVSRRDKDRKVEVEKKIKKYQQE